MCWVLKQLFSIESLSGRLLFKGGTSLSKIFHAINRFSEDIDLAVDYVALGFVRDRDPRQEVPHDRFTIRSFVAEEFPKIVVDGDVPVLALLAKRTSWEKATILHAEHHRPENKPLPDRYSRHDYDVGMLAQGAIRSEGLADMPLLTQVVKHKETFYPSAWARYDLARPGAFRVVDGVSHGGLGKRLQEYGHDDLW